MPYVNVQITTGATRDQKAQLVKDITDSLVKVLGKKPEPTHVVIQEIADENWGFSGLLTDDWKKGQAQRPDNPRPGQSNSDLPPKTPQAVVQAQLDAYNAKDIEALLQTYAPEAEQYTLHGELLAKGHDQLRARFLARFTEPNLHAKLVTRVVVGNIVTDAELITRDFPEGLGTLEMLCIYKVAQGRIQKASFALGQKTIHTPAGHD